MELVRVKNLKKSYGKNDTLVNALNGIDLTIDKGEFISVVGASGSGKSTLLHIIGGVDRANEGEVFIEGENINKYTEDQLAVFRRRKVGLIYQFFNLIPNLTVEKNIVLPLKLDNKKVDTDKYKDLVTKLGLEKLLNRFPSELSGGQSQRVAIARSLIYEPALILADEPTGNLDRKNSLEILKILKYANLNYKQTIIMVTHDLELAALAKRIITISDGLIIRDELR